jgi:hypothetical protein
MNGHVNLNEHHRRRLLVSCQYIDRLLSDIESVLNADASLSPFPRYVQDFSPGEAEMLQARVASLRSQLVSLLKRWKIGVPEPGISAQHSVLTSLSYIDITVEEMKPRYLGGYGPVPELVSPELNSSVEQLQLAVKATISVVKGFSRRGDPRTGEP